MNNHDQNPANSSHTKSPQQQQTTTDHKINWEAMDKDSFFELLRDDSENPYINPINFIDEKLSELGAIMFEINNITHELTTYVANNKQGVIDFYQFQDAWKRHIFSEAYRRGLLRKIDTKTHKNIAKHGLSNAHFIDVKKYSEVKKMAETTLEASSALLVTYDELLDVLVKAVEARQ